MAKYLVKIERYSEALEPLKEALSYSASDFDALSLLAMVHSKLGQWNQCIVVSKRAIASKTWPGNEDVRSSQIASVNVCIAEALIRTNNVDEALSYYDAAFNLGDWSVAETYLSLLK